MICLCLPALVSGGQSLAGGDARSDRLIDVELEQILTELPPGGVFITSSDHVAMGLLYKQFAEGQRPDIAVIVGSMLTSRSYREVLRRRGFAFLEELDFRQPLSIEEVAAAAVADQRMIFARPEARLPKGLGRWPIGVVWQWLPLADAPADGEIAQRLLAFCARWPYQLAELPRERRNSQCLAGEVFFNQFIAFFRKYDSDLLGRVVGALKSGSIESARSVCAAELQESYGLVDTIPRYYGLPGDAELLAR